MSITTETRRASFESIATIRGPRCQIIVDAIYEYGPLTVDELMERLDYTDPNQVRPRLTELVHDGVLQTVGKKESKISGKMVAVYGLVGQKETAPGTANTEGGRQAEAENLNHSFIIGGKDEKSKKKIYIFRVVHPSYPTQTVEAEDYNSAILAASNAWGLGRDWPSILDEVSALRISEVRR